MKHFILIASLALPLPALAQEAPPDETSPQTGEVREGFSLMEEGAKLMFRGMMSEMAPTLDQFGSMAQELGPAFELLATEMGPALMELMRHLDSVRYYQAPEILPNGDILIRRSPDAPEYVPPESDALPDDEEIDL